MLGSNFGKLFERIINNRLVPKLRMTEAQAGGKKGKATVDHLLRLKDTIQHIRANKKQAYIAFLDVTKAYDKAWLDAILYVMHKEGADLQNWKLAKELNTNLTATLKTKHGLTRRINIKDSIRQGGVLSVIQYALLMDEINKEIINQNTGPRMENIEEPIGCLLWMDDVALITDKPEDLQKMLNITQEIANRYHIEFGEAKSKILKVGRNKNKPEFHLGTMKLKYEQTYKYLGETMNEKGNLANQIPEIRRKTEAAYQTILTVMGNQQFQNIQLETAWKLLETCIQPIITYGGETWATNKKEEKTINQIQENIIRRILMVPQTTPIETLYIETGLLDIATITSKNRLNMEKRLKKQPDKITTKIMELNTKGGWKEKTRELKSKMTRNDHIDIKTYFKEKIEKQAEGKTKVQYLLTNKQWTPGIRPDYMNKLTRKQASTIFKARTRMLDVKNNYRGKFNDNICRMCNAAVETQDHILETCPNIHQHDQTKITNTNIFDENTTELGNTANAILKIMIKLEGKN